MFADVLLALPLGLLLAFTIGPVFFVLLETAITKGFRAAIAFNSGVVLADAVFILIVYFTTSSLLREIKENAHLQVTEKVNYIALFIKGFLLNFINIGVLGFWLGIIIVFGPKLDMNASRIFVFFTSIILAYFGIDIIKILIAKKLKNRLTAFHIYKIKRAISIILLVFGVFLIFQAFFPNVLQLTN